MKKVLISLTIMLLCVGGLASKSHALTLGALQYSVFVQGPEDDGSGITLPDFFSFKIQSQPFTSYNSSPIFDFPFIDSSAHGLMTTITAADPVFNDYANLLTNGSDDIYHTLFTMGDEPYYVRDFPDFYDSSFSPTTYKTNGIDFEGNTISSIQMLFDKVYFAADDSSAEFRGIFIVNGEPINGEGDPTNAVPEPASLVLLGSGLVGAFLRRRNKV